MTDTDTDNSLKWLLRVIGGVELCAIPFIVFPLSWMDWVHGHLLGLGSLPVAPVVEYLARSLSALYAIHGAMIVRMSFDIARFLPLVVFLGWCHVALGLTVFGADAVAGLPWFWVTGEGVGITACGVIILTLCRSRSTNASSRSGN
jgi:hypothetical protein